LDGPVGGQPFGDIHQAIVVVGGEGRALAHRLLEADTQPRFTFRFAVSKGCSSTECHLDQPISVDSVVVVSVVVLVDDGVALAA
jgi:hypothetical protein